MEVLHHLESSRHDTQDKKLWEYKGSDLLLETESGN